MTNKQSTKSQKPRNKTISLKDIQRQSKKMNTLSTYILDTDYETNTNTVIKYYGEFDQKRIDAILLEVYENIQYAEEEKLDFFLDDSQFLPYVFFIIAVRMTSLDKDVPTTLPEQIPIMSNMLSTGLYNRIFNEILPPEQVEKITDRLQEFQAIVEQVGNLSLNATQEINDKVVNKEIFSSLQPNNPMVAD